jgi:putative DNA primase/helicase
MDGSIGTQERPLASADAMDVARALLSALLTTPEGRPGLLWHRGDYYAWYGNRWRRQSPGWVEDCCWNGLADAFATTPDGGIARYRATRTRIGDVMRALAAITRIPHTQTPCTLDGTLRDLPLDRYIAFDDGVYSIPTDELLPRMASWFDPITVPVTLVEAAEPVRWMQALDEWSKGDPVWIDLLKRWFGYALMPHNDYARWLLMYGKVRSGKGTIARVLRALLGTDGYVGTSLYNLAERFGLEGLHLARIICVHEVSQLDNREGERCVGTLKTILGQDPVDIDRKNQSIIRNITFPAKVMMQSNEIPRLPNKGQGLSSKMLVLPFDVTFAGREDHTLASHLIDHELPGIARWALEGARELEASDPSGRFPVPDRSRDAVALYHITNSPFDAFLKARFLQDEQGFVSLSLIWNEWLHWRKINHIKGNTVPRNNLGWRIEQESSWHVNRYRHHAGARGLRGLSLRRIPDEDHL